MRGFQCGQHFAALVNIVAENFRVSDELYLGLIQGRVTYGEYARAKQEVNARTNASITAVDQQIAGQLAQSHEYELAQRRQAAMALSAWAQNQQQIQQQQQMINAVNRPRQTRCNYFGNQLNCTTQ